MLFEVGVVQYYITAVVVGFNVGMALNIIMLISALFIVKRRKISFDNKVKVMSKTIIVIIFINIFLIMQSIGVEAFLETLSGVMINNINLYVENSLAVNTLNMIVYLLFIIFIYRFNSIKKSLFLGYTILLFPYFNYLGGEVRLKYILNIIVMSVLGIIIMKYIIDNYDGIEKKMNEKVKIRFRYLFIPIFGFIIIFLKMVINNSIGYGRILFLILFSIVYYMFGFIISVDMNSDLYFLASAMLALIFIATYQMIVYLVIYSGYKKRSPNE